MAAGDDTPDISHIPGPASRPVSQTCHRQAVVSYVSRGGGRGGGIRRRRLGGFRDGAAGNQRVPAGAGLPSGEGAGAGMARGVSRNPSGKPRENRGKTAFPAPEISGNPGFPSFPRRRHGAYPSHAGRRYARAGGGSGAGG